MTKKIVFWVLMISLCVNAKTILVSPEQKIQTALDQAKAGDVVKLAPGIYRERVRFKNSGKYGKPITLIGPREAVIDASENIKLHWEKLPEYGPNAWHAKLPEVFTHDRNGKILVACKDGLIPVLFEKRVTPGTPSYSGPPNAKGIGSKLNWDKKLLFQNGVGKFGWKGVVGLAMYRRKEKDVVVAFGDGRPVPQQGIVVSPNEAAILIRKADRCVVSGITIRHATQGVVISNSCGSVVENCRIERSDFGVNMIEDTDRCTVRFCEISHDTIFNISPLVPESWDAWMAYKIGGYWDRIGVNMLHTKGGHQIHDNYIHHHWGGVQDTGAIGENQNLNVHHNRIDLIQDDGLEPDGAEENCQWHDNFVTRCRCGFRVKVIKRGPLYAYNNIMAQSREDFRHFKSVKNAVLIAYHNTSVTPTAIKNNGVPEDIGTPNYCYYNNLFVCDDIFGGNYAKADWHDDGNLYVVSGKNPNWQKNWDDLHAPSFHSTSKIMVGDPKFIDMGSLNFTLKSDSQARNAGVDLSDKNLPGLEKHQEKNPDVGALPYGSAMPEIPRKMTDVECEKAGFFPKE